MTSVNLSTQTPATITTVERNIVWAATVLQDLFPNETVEEFPGELERVIQAAPIFVTAGSAPGWRYIGRFSIPLQGTWRRGGKIWTYAQEVGTTALPAEYQS